MTVQSGPHILAIGEALIDVVITHEQPDFPVEVPGGSPANVALTLGRLGRPVALATWIGLDERGRLDALGVLGQTEVVQEHRGGEDRGGRYGGKQAFHGATTSFGRAEGGNVQCY